MTTATNQLGMRSILIPFRVKKEKVLFWNGENAFKSKRQRGGYTMWRIWVTRSTVNNTCKRDASVRVGLVHFLFIASFRLQSAGSIHYINWCQFLQTWTYKISSITFVPSQAFFYFFVFSSFEFVRLSCVWYFNVNLLIIQKATEYPISKSNNRYQRQLVRCDMTIRSTDRTTISM